VSQNRKGCKKGSYANVFFSLECDRAKETSESPFHQCTFLTFIIDDSGDFRKVNYFDWLAHSFTAPKATFSPELVSPIRVSCLAKDTIT
jgi:hypothetical protein